MRIAIVTSWPTNVLAGSGTAVFYHALAAGLRQSGYELDVIAPNFDVSNYVKATLQRLLFNTELRTEPRVLSADLVIGFDYDGYGLDPAVRPPMVTSAHAVYADVIQWEVEPFRTMVEAQAFFDQVAMQRTDAITIGSEYAKERIVTLYGIAPEKITVIPHGMIDPAWLPLVASVPQVPNDHPVILSVGKMFPRKRIDVLLRALPLLLPRYPTLELRVVGDGLDWERLHALASELRLDAHVSWLGHIGDDSDFAREWRQADIFCHPSCQETFGYVYLEAMTLGRPIVAVRAGAAPEVLGEAALLAEPENPAALADALQQFLSDPALGRNYGELARARAPIFSHKRMIQGYIAIIERLTQNRAAAVSLSRRDE